MKPYRMIEEGGLWRAYAAGMLHRRTGDGTLLRMPMAVEVKQVGDKDSRVLRFTASTEDEDRDGDIIKAEGWDVGNFLKNPVQLWAHNMRQDHPPIGKTIKLEVGNGKMINEVDFFMAEDFPLAALALKAHLAGVGAESVGFMPLKATERHGQNGQLIGFVFEEQELLEISSVPVPSNPNALMSATQKGLLKPEEAEQIEKIWAPHLVKPIHIYEMDGGRLAPAGEELKAVVPFKEYPLADLEAGWDAGAAVDRLRKAAGGPEKDGMDWTRYRSYFAIYDAENPEAFGSYKLPHHDVIDGQVKTVFRGVVAAIAVINGARGGVNASEAEKRGAYNHLARHIREFDREPPPFGGAEGMTEGERKAMQEYHLAMAESYGLRIQVQVSAPATGEGETKLLEEITKDVQAIATQVAAQEQALGTRVREAVQQAVAA